MSVDANGLYWKDQGTYEQFVSAAIGFAFADQTHLAALAELLNVRLIVVRNCANSDPLPIHQRVTELPLAEIVLTNNNLHYTAIVRPDRDGIMRGVPPV